MAAARRTCPAGHALQPWAAEAGTCNGCRRLVLFAERVMDCRECNFYLCSDCTQADRLRGLMSAVLACQAPDRQELESTELTLDDPSKRRKAPATRPFPEHVTGELAAPTPTAGDPAGEQEGGGARQPAQRGPEPQEPARAPRPRHQEAPSLLDLGEGEPCAPAADLRGQAAPSLLDLGEGELWAPAPDLKGQKTSARQPSSHVLARGGL